MLRICDDYNAKCIKIYLLHIIHVNRIERCAWQINIFMDFI